MDETQQPMRMNMFGKDVAWWSKNQVAFTFHSPLPPTQQNKKAIIESLHLDDLNRFLGESLHLTLKSFEDKDIPHPHQPEAPGGSFVDQGIELLGKGLKVVGQGIERLGEGIEELGDKLLAPSEKGGVESVVDQNGEGDDDDNGLNSPRGKYLFPSPDRTDTTTMITFFNIEPIAGTEDTPAMVEAGGKDADHTVEVVNLFNTTPFLPVGGMQISIPPAMPNWLGGGTPDGIHGCPAEPPMSVAADSAQIATGYCPIKLELSPSMTEQQGKGVRVFVLDSYPTPEQIIQASGLANPTGRKDGKNLLLLDMATGMKTALPFNAPAPAINLNYLVQSDTLESVDAPRTGRDLYRKLYGFKMPDHGLFVTGIIRDLAKEANIECVRILNDYGVGSVSGLMQALETIQGRMLTGDLQGTPVVINLSLVMTPSSELFSVLGFMPQVHDVPDPQSSRDDLISFSDLRAGLHEVITSIVNTGAVIVAAAGNDSNSPETLGRADPRYPARFPEVVSVASVAKDGKTASIFSNRGTVPGEQPNGIATYGGNIAEPVAPPTTGKSVTIVPPPANCMTGAKNLDAIVGIYTSPTYPKLADKHDGSNGDIVYVGDCQDYYPAPNQSSWAYWAGTSFSTPMITALVARIISSKIVSGTLSSAQVIATINSGRVSLIGVLPTNPDLKAVVLKAAQS